MDDEAVVGPDFRERVRRLGPMLDRVEQVYLTVLRASVLLIASAMLLYAAWLGLSGLYKVVQSPSSVTEAVANVTADDLVNAQLEEPIATIDTRPQATPEQRKFYANFLDRYYRLFRTKFAPFKQVEDKQLSKDEFDDTYLQSHARLNAVVAGEKNFSADKASLESLFSVMSAAAENPDLKKRLRAYKIAKKVRVPHQVQRTRTEYRSGWNSYSTSCENWFYSPVGCSERRAVSVPYTTTEFAMEFPEGTQSHATLFHQLQDRYFTLLDERREQNRLAAEVARTKISVGNIQGSENLSFALRTIAAFIAIMFFFLLIAIERHQRLARPREAQSSP